jgi:uncharacterized protein YbjT (DUF2867 family)
MKTAIVIGATGLVGNKIVSKLLNDSRYEKIKVFGRRALKISNSKLEEYIIDFDHLEDWKQKITGDELYSALGTTIKKAGSKEAQNKIDFSYQYEMARIASENNVNKMLLVSSLGANSKSGNFYLRIKGELEDAALELPFKNIFIFRPSILMGDRTEKRFGESVGINLAKIFSKIPPLKKYRPVKAEEVAESMIKSANIESNIKIEIIESEKIFEIANS